MPRVKTHKAFKVVIQRGDRRFSAINTDWAPTEYFQRRYTKGKIGLCYVFDTVGHAREFFHTPGNDWAGEKRELWEVRCRGRFEPASGLLYRYRPDDTRVYWQRFFSGLGVIWASTHVPDGSYWTEEVMLVKQLEEVQR